MYIGKQKLNLMSVSSLFQVSTPSADTAERNIMSMLSVSTESIDRVGRRENFLKTNFESLEGEVTRPEKEGIKNKNRLVLLKFTR